MAALLDFGRISGFEKQFDRLLQILAGGFDGFALTGDIQLGAECDITVAFALDNRGYLSDMSHVFILKQQT